MERYKPLFPMSESIIKKRVVRNGKKVIRYTSDKPGYKIDMSSGNPKEVKMSPEEIRKHYKAGKKAAKKTKGKLNQIDIKRKRSLAKK